jgi:nucleotide-binding universal stress UspA family protein
MFRKILVPIDTAEPAVAEPGVYFAAQLAALTNAAVRMVHVLPTIPLNLLELLPPHVSADRETRPAIRSLRWQKKLTFRWAGDARTEIVSALHLRIDPPKVFHLTPVGPAGLLNLFIFSVTALAANRASAY